MLQLYEKYSLQYFQPVSVSVSLLPRAIIITGSGDRSFSAGFDVQHDNPMVNSIFDVVGSGDSTPARQAIAHIRQAVDAFVLLPVPLIAAVNGDA